MDLDLAAELRGLLALLVLALLPGLAVVRAPWTAVPFLSLSFWLLSAFWVPAARSAFLGGALLFFALLTALRLLKPLPRSRPSGRSLALLGLALACPLPVVVLPVAPGLSLASTEATLLAWRDGWPSSYEPLAPIPAFGAHAPGLPWLAADVSRLAGLPPHRAVLLVALAGAGLLVLAGGSLFERWGRPRRGLALGALVAAASLLPAAVHGVLGASRESWLERWPLLERGSGPAVFAAALGLSALALLVRGSGRAPAVAAGSFLAAACVVDVASAAVCFGLVAFCGDRVRRRWALGLGLLIALPHLASLRAFSIDELRAGAREAWASAIVGPGSRGRRLPDPSALRAFAWIQDHTEPLARVCAAPGGAATFLPALAHRALVPAEVPLAYREEASRSAERPCRYLLWLGSPGAPFTPPSAPFGPSARVVFHEGGVRVLETASLDAPVTSFDNDHGNPGPAPP